MRRRMTSCAIADVPTPANTVNARTFNSIRIVFVMVYPPNRRPALFSLRTSPSVASALGVNAPIQPISALPVDLRCAAGLHTAIRIPALSLHGSRYLRPTGHRLRARQRGVGAADRVRARLRGIARLYLAADPGLGGAGRDRRADRAERHQFLAGVDRRQPRRRLRRLAVLLDWAQARAFGRAHLAAVAPSRSDLEGRSLHEEMGHARNFYRPFLWAVTRRGAADRRHFRNAVLAFSTRQFYLGLRVGGHTAHDRRRHFEGAAVVVALTGEKTPPGFRSRRKSSYRLRYYLSAATPACESTSSCAPAPPLTPMAPITLPPTISGLPPRDAITSSSDNRYSTVSYTHLTLQTN